MRELTPLLLAVLAGLLTTLEATVNGKLGTIVTPKIATLHSLVTGVIIVLTVNLVKGTLNQYIKIIHVSPQWLVGGIFGSLIIYLVAKTIPKLGISTTLTIIVASQIMFGLFIDVFISKQHQLDWYKLTGVLLLLAGTYFITK